MSLRSGFFRRAIPRIYGDAGANTYRLAAANCVTEKIVGIELEVALQQAFRTAAVADPVSMLGSQGHLNQCWLLISTWIRRDSNTFFISPFGFVFGLGGVVFLSLCTCIISSDFLNQSFYDDWTLPENKRKANLFRVRSGGWLV